MVVKDVETVDVAEDDADEDGVEAEDEDEGAAPDPEPSPAPAGSEPRQPPGRRGGAH